MHAETSWSHDTDVGDRRHRGDGEYGESDGAPSGLARASVRAVALVKVSCAAAGQKSRRRMPAWGCDLAFTVSGVA